ncbi:MAG: hypothetical protein WKG00_18655 [Polyangiaceae bacterium]
MTVELGGLATAAVFSFLLAACGGDVSAPGAQSGDEAAGSGASAASGDASSGEGGASAASTGSGFGGVGTSSTTGAGGTPAACAGAFVEVTIDAGPTSTLGSVCGDDWSAQFSSVPAGYYVSGGPAQAVSSLHLVGCANATPDSEGLRLSAQVDGPGAYGGQALYTDQAKNLFPELPAGSVALTLSSVGQVGETIEGTYQAMVAKDEIAFSIKGAFRVCHVEDENLP